jgi:MscS family membrane protein
LFLGGFFFLVSNYLINYLIKQDKLTYWKLFLVEAIKQPLKVLIILLTLSEIWELYEAGNRQRLEILSTIAIFTWAALTFIKKLEKYYLKSNSFSNHKDKEAKKSAIVLAMKLFFVTTLVLGIITILQAAGVEMQAIIAFVSLSGVTIGIASRDLVAGLFGTMIIYTTRPFALGDRIKINNLEGVVEDINWIATRVRLDNKKLSYIPNIQFLSGALENLSKSSYRRLSFSLQLFLHDLKIIEASYEEILGQLTPFNKSNHLNYELIEATEVRSQVKYSLYLDKNISQRNFILLKMTFFKLIEEILTRNNIRFSIKFED